MTDLLPGPSGRFLLPGPSGDFGVDRFAARVGVPPGDYHALWRWSVENLEDFWAAVWDHFDVRPSAPYDRVLTSRAMPGASWFQGARLNYVDQVLRHRDLPGAAVISLDEAGRRTQTSWAELADQVTAFAATLRGLGVVAGDRVVGYLTNDVETIVAFLGTAAVGATWAACGPDYGAAAAGDRLAQLRPSVLVATTGYRFGGTLRDRRQEMLLLAERLGPEVPVIVVDHLDLGLPPATRPLLTWADAVTGPAESGHPTEHVTQQVLADHPLWVLFSSGTTGVPKGIVHPHAGVLVTHLSMLGLQADLSAGDTFFWYTTTNWMMWNIVASALLVGATTVTYDGSPVSPDPRRLWEIAATEHVSVFGTSPGHVQGAISADVDVTDLDFGALRQVLLTGAPAPAHLNGWVSEHVAHVPVVSTSGGTDIVAGFVNGAPYLPVTPGEIPGPVLGVAVAVFDPDGQPVRDRIGELVVTAPMPSMPTHFWDDADGEKYRSAYFDTYPGIWRHGDWATQTSRDSFVIHGRSDATLNRNGVRIGSADLYEIVEDDPDIAEALVVGVELPDGSYRMPMYVVTRPGVELTDALAERLRTSLRTHGSPRHVPDQITAVPALPHTRTGKKLEVPIKRILQGAAPADVISIAAVDDPSLIDFYVDQARRWRA